MTARKAFKNEDSLNKSLTVRQSAGSPNGLATRLSTLLAELGGGGQLNELAPTQHHHARRSELPHLLALTLVGGGAVDGSNAAGSCTCCTLQPRQHPLRLPLQ